MRPTKPRLDIRQAKAPTARNFTLGMFVTGQGRRCAAKITDGKPCANDCSPGMTLCRQHKHMARRR